jgi:uncharacterized protein (DUF433 family)
MPFSIRLAEATIANLKAQAAGHGETPRTVAQRYIEEGLRQDRHPLIRFASGPAGRRAALVGTGLDVWEVIATIQDNNGNLETAADYLDVSPTVVDAAATYYGAFPEEVDRMISANVSAAQEAYKGWAAGRHSLGS